MARARETNLSEKRKQEKTCQKNGKEDSQNVEDSMENEELWQTTSQFKRLKFKWLDSKKRHPTRQVAGNIFHSATTGNPPPAHAHPHTHTKPQTQPTKENTPTSKRFSPKISMGNASLLSIASFNFKRRISFNIAPIEKF